MPPCECITQQAIVDARARLCCSVLTMQVLLSEPATDHSLQPEIAKLYDTDRAAFNKAARDHTKRFAM